MTKEEWRPIEGYEGFYEVSNLGQVRSLDRVVKDSRCKRIFKGKVLKTSKDINGYHYVDLTKEAKRKKFLLHRLVAVAFLGQPSKGHVVCHGPKGNQCNEVTNLSWGTREKNNGPDKVRDGTDNRGENHGSAKLNKMQVRVIRRLLESKSMTQKEIGDIFGVKQVTVSQIKVGTIWGHLESNKEFNCIS